MLCTFALALSPAAGAFGEPESKAPFATAAAHAPFQWKSAAGLRYVWWLPPDYDGKTPRNLTVILHGTGLDYRWGWLNHPAEAFRPQDVVVSVDGTSPGEGDTRLFLDGDADAESFHNFLGEMRASFAVDRVFLYGHSQGGFFVTWYAGLHPEDVAGVCAHASGAWRSASSAKKVQKVAVAFLHGTADPVVPYGQSAAAWAHYLEEGFPMVLLRRMPGYNHWPNAVRATECLDWCEGMTTQNPDRALALAKELLRPKGQDEYQYEIPPAFAAARMVLRRFSGEGHDPFGNQPPTVQGYADELVAAVDRQSAQVAEGLQRVLGKKLELKSAPIAALRAYREDFRGVESAERWLGKLGFDKAAFSHDEKAKAVYEAWYAEKMPDGERFAAICAALKECWLRDGFPPELAAKLDEWKGQERSLGIDKKALKNYADYAAPWIQGWNAEAWNLYARLCANWKVPK